MHSSGISPCSLRGNALNEEAKRALRAAVAAAKISKSRGSQRRKSLFERMGISLTKKPASAPASAASAGIAIELD